MTEKTRSFIFEKKVLEPFFLKIEDIIKQKGGKIETGRYNAPLEYTFFLGEDWIPDENGVDYHRTPKEIGNTETIIHLHSENRTDDNGEKYKHKTWFEIRKYTFTKSSKNLIPEILSALPTKILSRIVTTTEGIEIYFYIALEEEEVTNLQRQAEPLPNGVILFGQGEWVIVSGDNENHVLASWGKATEACRQYLLYDPVTKKAAATHLDLLHDIDAINEMSGHLARAGCDPRNLQLWASSDMDPSTMQIIKMMYPHATFNLDEDYEFDTRTGEFAEISKETEQQILSTMTRCDENSPIRWKYDIPHLLVYDS